MVKAVTVTAPRRRQVRLRALVARHRLPMVPALARPTVPVLPDRLAQPEVVEEIPVRAVKFASSQNVSKRLLQKGAWNIPSFTNWKPAFVGSHVDLVELVNVK